MSDTKARHTIRRVVTRLDDSDKAIVLIDELREGVVRAGRNVVTNVIWSTDRSPAGFDGTADAALRQAGIVPKANGTVFRILDYPPAGQVALAAGGHAPAARPSEEPEIRGLPPRHPGMHRTRTLDYVIVLSGEIYMLLDDTEIHLRQGDVLVQQATNHAWVNRSDETCRIAIVLVDSEAP